MASKVVNPPQMGGALYRHAVLTNVQIYRSIRPPSQYKGIISGIFQLAPHFPPRLAKEKFCAVRPGDLPQICQRYPAKPGKPATGPFTKIRQFSGSKAGVPADTISQNNLKASPLPPMNRSTKGAVGSVRYCRPINSLLISCRHIQNQSFFAAP